MADALFGVALRLPGAPAVFFTLLGTLWAVGRSLSKIPADGAGRPSRWAQWLTARRLTVCASACVLAVLAGWLTWRDWTGVRAEWSATLARQDARHDDAIAQYQRAEQHLLDPVRQLIAQRRGIESQFATGLRLRSRSRSAPPQACGVTRPRRASTPDNTEQTPGPETQSASATESADRAQTATTIETAIRRCEATYAAAGEWNQHAPNCGPMGLLGARCAELLAQLHGRRGADAVDRDWHERAYQAWLAQRTLRPFDPTTLMALTHYPQSPAAYLGLLRDALRNGFATQAWYSAYARIAEHPELDETITAMMDALGPWNPSSDIDPLMH